MTINEFIDWLGRNAWITAAALATVPLFTLLWGLFHRTERSALSPWKQGYSVLVYLACIPGMFAAVLVAYALFFSRRNLLDVNVLVYFLPLFTMATTLLLIRRRVAFDALPGFGRLWGLMIMLALSFGLALAIDRTRIFLGFFGSIDRLFILVGALFALIAGGFRLAFGRGRARR